MTRRLTHRYRRSRSRLKPSLRILVALAVGLCLITIPATMHATDVGPVQKKVVRVMTIGGSIARGEKDPDLKGYLQRAFGSLTDSTNTKYVYYDRTIHGANGTQLATLYKGRYEHWLNQVKPGVVVISWGLLNDALPNTPLPKFTGYIRQEINEARSKKAVVFVVTPPVTEAALTKFPKQENMYAAAEMRLVQHMKLPEVYAFDLFHQMNQYLAAHHQSYVEYVGDANHPNRAGHILAGQLLYHDIVAVFGTNPI